MNIASNPWNFVPGDIISASVTTLVQQTPNNALFVLTTSAALLLGPSQFLTITGATIANGWYKILAGTFGGTVFTVQNLSTPTQGTPINYSGASQAAGTVYWNQYQANVRAEDMSWQNIPVSASLSVLDRNGNLVWSANSLSGQTNTQNRGKPLWVDGLTLQTMTAASNLIVTVN